METFDFANPFVRRYQCQRHAHDSIAALEDAFAYLRRRGNMKDSLSIRMSIPKMKDGSNRIIHWRRRHVVLVVLDRDTGHDAALDHAMSSLQLIVAAELRVSPDESQTEDIARNAELVGLHDELLADPFAGGVASGDRMNLLIDGTQLADGASAIFRSRSEHTCCRHVVDELRLVLCRKLQQFDRAADVGAFRHRVRLQVIHAGGAVIDGVDRSAQEFMSDGVDTELRLTQVARHWNDASSEPVVPQVVSAQFVLENTQALLLVFASEQAV